MLSFVEMICLLGFATCWFVLLVRFGMFVGVVCGLCLLMLICAFSICAHVICSGRAEFLFV